MSKVSAIYHVVFCTYQRKMTIPSEECEHLYRFIWKTVQNKKCKLIRIGGIANHLHLLIWLNPQVALSDLMRQIKSESSKWLLADERFPLFEKWGHEYYAATLGYEDCDSVIEYIKSQPVHHADMEFSNEIRCLCSREGLSLHPDDFN